MHKKHTVILTLLFSTFSISVFSETIVLKSGKTVEGTILEKTDSSINVDIEGIPITYYLDEIQSIDGISPTNKETIQNNLSQTNTAEPPSTGIDTEHIHIILKHLGYPENTWPAIEKELIAFLTKINFPSLKVEVEQIKSNPEQLKGFIAKLGGLIEEEGCINYHSPHPLLKLLIVSFTDEDIFQLIETSPISQQEKDYLKETIISCSAVSQLGSILLDLLDIKVKAIFSKAHTFNCIPLNDQRFIFVDFMNQEFDIVDLLQYYQTTSKYYVLKEEYRLSPKRLREIAEQWYQGLRQNTLKDRLNFPYFYIYIAENFSATPAIYTNIGICYYKHGDITQAIYNHSKAIEVNPDSEEAYSNRAVAYESLGNFSQALSDCNKAIEINPSDAEAYYNRGLFYKNQGDIFQAIRDYTRAIEINPNLAQAYGNRGNAYVAEGNTAQAISDYTSLIEINPNDASAYYYRGAAFFTNKNFSKAWEDVHKAESLGASIDPNFLEELKKASGREK